MLFYYDTGNKYQIKIIWNHRNIMDIFYLGNHEPVLGGSQLLFSIEIGISLSLWSTEPNSILFCLHLRLPMHALLITV